MFYVLLVLALIRPLGFILHSPQVDGIGAATCISPLPAVFSSPGGIEAFSSEYFIISEKTGGGIDTTKLGPREFATLNYPYPFRNAVSISFGYFALIADSTAKKILHHLFYTNKVLHGMGIPHSPYYVLVNRNTAGETRKEWSIKIKEHEDH